MGAGELCALCSAITRMRSPNVKAVSKYHNCSFDPTCDQIHHTSAYMKYSSISWPPAHHYSRWYKTIDPARASTKYIVPVSLNLQKQLRLFSTISKLGERMIGPVTNSLADTRIIEAWSGNGTCVSSASSSDIRLHKRGFGDGNLSRNVTLAGSLHCHVGFLVVR